MYLIIFVVLIHASITLLFGDDFPRILYNNLMSLKAPIAAYTIASVSSLDDFYPDSIFSALAPTFL
jgi:hypothetical protein